MRRSLHYLLLSTVTVVLQLQAQIPQLLQDRATGLSRRISDRNLAATERRQALAELEHTDLPRAVQLSSGLLAEEDLSLRLRAAWILADDGDSRGIQVLRSMASERTEESTIAMTTLGRLRDEGSHGLLRGLLERELGAERRHDTASRVSALSKALSDYTDSADAALLAQAVNFPFGLTNWTKVNDLGKTSGRAAIPALDEIFDRTGEGAAVVAAGLGLARCGSEKGIKFIRERFASLRPGSTQPESQQGAGRTAFAFSPRGTDFIFELLGVPADEVFVPNLLQIVSRLEYPSRTRAQAWGALLRINSQKYRKETLALAWKNTIYQSAVRLIALNDESGARRALTETEAKGAQALGAYDADLLKWALAATRRERREWLETHGYTF